MPCLIWVTMTSEGHVKNALHMQGAKQAHQTHSFSLNLPWWGFLSEVVELQLVVRSANTAVKELMDHMIKIDGKVHMLNASRVWEQERNNPPYHLGNETPLARLHNSLIQNFIMKLCLWSSLNELMGWFLPFVFILVWTKLRHQKHIILVSSPEVGSGLLFEGPKGQGEADGDTFGSSLGVKLSSGPALRDFPQTPWQR